MSGRRGADYHEGDGPRMSGHATKRINEIYAELKEKYGRSLGTDTVSLELLAIKHYLDERLSELSSVPQKEK